MKIFYQMLNTLDGPNHSVRHEQELFGIEVRALWSLIRSFLNVQIKGPKREYHMLTFYLLLLVTSSNHGKHID